MSYRINHAAVRELAAELGIQGRVEIQRRRCTIDRRGQWTYSPNLNGQHRHYLRPSLPNPLTASRHLISLAGDRPPHEVAETIAHELCHALQATEAILADGTFGWIERSRREGELPYDERPIELEADAFAESWGPEVLRRCIVQPEKVS